jgi:hypothetical protein
MPPAQTKQATIMQQHSMLQSTHAVGKYIEAAQQGDFLTRLVGPHCGDRTAQTVTVSKAATTPS